MKIKKNQGKKESDRMRFNRYDVSSRNKWQEMKENRKRPVLWNDSMNAARIGERGNDLWFCWIEYLTKHIFIIKKNIFH